MKKRIENAIRKAALKQDWDTVQKLENILKTRNERLKIAAETKMIETNQKIAEKTAELAAVKSDVDIEKTLLDRKIAWITLFFGSGIFATIINFIKDLPFIKQFFEK